jgi:dTDP-4-dehydrorhamnose reductase
MLRLGQERSELRVVDDQRGAPTSALALATATRRILDGSADRRLKKAAGIYHMTCSGETTWFHFAQAIFAQAQADKPWASVIGIPSSEYPTPATRPANSVLSNRKLKMVFGVELPSWESALLEALRSLETQRA